MSARLKTATVDDQFVLSLSSNFKFTTSLSAVLSFGIILFTEKFSQDDQNFLLWCLTYCLRSGLSPPTSPACLVERVGSFFVFLCVQRYILKPRLCGQHFKIYHMCERSFSVPVSHHCDPVRTDQCFQLWRVQKCLLWKKTNWFFWPFTMSWCSASVFHRIWSISAAPSLQGERFNFIVRKADVCWMSGVQVVFVPDVTGFNYIRLNNVHDIVSTI